MPKRVDHDQVARPSPSKSPTVYVGARALQRVESLQAKPHLDATSVGQLQLHAGRVEVGSFVRAPIAMPPDRAGVVRVEQIDAAVGVQIEQSLKLPIVADARGMLESSAPASTARRARQKRRDCRGPVLR